MTNKESLKALVHLARVCKEEYPEIITRNFRGFSDKGAHIFISAAINTVEEMLNEDDAEPTPAEDKDCRVIVDVLKDISDMAEYLKGEEVPLGIATDLAEISDNLRSYVELAQREFNGKPFHLPFVQVNIDKLHRFIDAHNLNAEDKDKWIIDETPEYNGCGYAYYICPKCGKKQTRYTPHCPMCGKGLSS